MLEVSRSSVNTWECDQMGHLNVRHYFARAAQGLGVLAWHLGLGPAQLRTQGLALRTREHHVRFLKELRPGTPFTLSAGVLTASRERLRVYEELRIVHSAAVAATVVSDVVLETGVTGEQHAFSNELVQRALGLQVTLPEYATARGISLKSPRARPSRHEALEKGMIPAFLGPVLREDCDEHGLMHESMFMARISDGFGHVFNTLRQGLRPDGIGGAALEYRFVYHARPRPSDLLEVRSGLSGLGRKTLHFAHWVFDMETGACAATSEAVAVSFDLTLRKAVEIPDDARNIMQPQIIADLTA